ncbi:cation:proton antiporter [Chelatococcus sp. SYSU_G07232]|uniref:Cation:proton antiporter n=1 Tax=Chelatococcus albus TaxID=3047466 RepID=A0ABT7AHC6_9HYPH|nr:cation:proton antiporter [Chelatococcus sp. SYSU_G07232]MDJ1158485.1 cation:proton antiporter [Chelatococcus sp. SYSU_G07232]
MAAALPIEAYKDALIVLATAGIVVPVVHRLKISPVLGFLGIGILIGPDGLSRLASAFPPLRYITVSDATQIERVAEFGVVFLMFVIGLELSWTRLWTMRRLVFGLGAAQVVLSSVVLALAAAALGAPPDAAVVLGSALALSSTAVVLGALTERRRLATGAGRASFAVLLFQDLAVVPILFMVGVLGARTDGSVAGGLALALTQAVLAIGVIAGLGRLALRPLFRLVAATDSPELFMAATLLVVVGTAFVTGAAGLSMPLGAFIAGLLLAETEFRREVEVTIEPFKGLLLGVFFLSVGMQVDIGLVAREPLLLLAAVLGLVVAKSAILFLLARAFGLSTPVAAELGLLLGPGGEFAFVVLGIAVSLKLIGAETGDLALVLTALTMALIPVLGRFAVWGTVRLAPDDELPAEARVAPPEDGTARAIVIGCGRVGQLVADMLEGQRIPYLAADANAALVALLRRTGKPVFYGDATRREFLRRCGIEEARALIVTIDASRAVDDIVSIARGLRPDLVIVARARDARHASHLYTLGVTHAVPETIEASLQLSEAALVGLGVPMGLAIAAVHDRRDLVRQELKAMKGERR